MLKTSLEAFLVEVEARFLVLPITATIARIAAEFPSAYPLDPMDRIIGATALAHGGCVDISNGRAEEPA